jgi:hypothetical protein
MAYTPVNLEAYTAAYAGALAGMAVNGWITSPEGSEYAFVCAIAGAFAEKFDEVWNSATDLNGLEYAAIEQAATQEFSLRGPGPLSAPQFSDPANWETAARACATLVLQADLYYASQGITPPLGPGQGGNVDPGIIDNQVPKWSIASNKYLPGFVKTSEITNDSSVPGADASDALENLAAGIATTNTRIDNLNSDEVANNSNIPGATVTDALNNIRTERVPTEMALVEIFREDWMAGVSPNGGATRSGIINPAFQTNRLQPTGLLWVNDPFTDTTFGRFTTVSEATPMTFTLPGSTAVLTSPVTAGNRMSLIYEGVALGMPHVMASIRIISRTGTDGAYSAVLLGVVKDSNNYIVVNWNTTAASGNLNIQTKIAGVNNFQADITLAASTMPITIAFSIIGNIMTVYSLPEAAGATQGLWQKLTSYDLTPRVDFKAEDMSQWFACFGFATPGTQLNVATYDDFKVGRFGGCGIRDICIVNHPDGSPYFLSATTVAALATLAAPSGGISGSSQGCFIIDLEKKTFTQTGVIMVSRGGKIQNDHAASMIIEDNGDQKLCISSWGDTPTAVKIYYKSQVAAINLLNGSNVVTPTAFTLPNPGGAVDYYDPYLIFKNGLYYLAYTVSTAGTGAPFYPALASCPDVNVPVWTLIGSDNTANRYEGTRILPFEGNSYVLTGGQFNMRMYDLTMTYVGIVNCLSPGDGTTQPHAMVFPYQQNNLYYLITFDQTKWPTVGGLDFSWGSHHWFASPRY